MKNIILIFSIFFFFTNSGQCNNPDKDTEEKYFKAYDFVCNLMKTDTSI